MGRFKADEVSNYGGQGGSGFFYLKNDKDVARVRFLYDNIDDVEGFAVHEVEVAGKKRYVNCLREYGQPMDSCPFCRAGRFQFAKLFIPIYDMDEEKVKIWERGKQFFAKISSLCARYDSLVSHVFEIERNGKPGSTSTTYEIYEVDRDDITLADLPENPNILGGLVLDKSFEDLEYYLESNEFPPEEEEEEVSERRSSTRASSRNRSEVSRGVERRTPANTNTSDRARRNRDRF